MTCCSLIWLGAGDKAECQIQISGQTWILYFSYQTSSCFGKVTLSPAHAMWRTPVICWKGGWSCCEKLPVPEPAYESLFLTWAAADGFVCWERRTAETCLDSSTGKKEKKEKEKKRKKLPNKNPFTVREPLFCSTYDASIKQTPLKNQLKGKATLIQEKLRQFETIHSALASSFEAS